MLAYMENALTGVRGIVRNQYGQSIEAAVEVVGIEDVGAPIRTDPSVGDYHRMLLPGTYPIRISAEGCDTLEASVAVASGVATRLDAVLQCR